MCFFFGLPSSASIIKKRYQRPMPNESLLEPKEQYNGFAYPTVAIISNDSATDISFGTWGLVPEWSKDLSFRKNTLNARIETIATLPSFRDYIENRCLIPASKFYEWRHEGKNKIPYTIVSNETEIFSFAGLYSYWTHPETNQTLKTFTILTTEANETMQYIHNTKQRMPVILHPTDEERWLGGDSIAPFAFPYSCSLKGIMT